MKYKIFTALALRIDAEFLLRLSRVLDVSVDVIWRADSREEKVLKKI